MQKNDRYIVFTAQHSGFGPVSKMLNIARMFRGGRLVFIGQGIALEYVNNSALGIFSEVLDYSKLSNKRLSALIDGSQYVINVMNHDIAFFCYHRGKRYYFLDSLFGFWYTRKKDKNIFKNFSDSFLKGEINQEKYNLLSVHEKKILSHVLARKSFIQNYFGVKERLVDISKFLSNSYLVEPFASGYVLKERNNNLNEEVLLVNLGGVKNFIIKDNNSDYYELIFRLVKDLLLSPSFVFKEAVICSGLYNKHGTTRLSNGALIKHVFLDNKKFLSLALRCKVCLSSPGLTSIYEFMKIGHNPIYLPEQHSSQYYNVKALRKATNMFRTLSITDIFENLKIPRNDYCGSKVIISNIKKINKDDDAYSKLLFLMKKYLSVNHSDDKIKINLLYESLKNESIPFVEVKKIIINDNR